MNHNDGIYIPPFKLARMKEENDDPSSEYAQRRHWDHLRKSIKGLINKVAIANINEIVEELFVHNLIRGRGLFVRSIMQAQLSLPVYTNVYAALVAVVNSKIPAIGELMLNRIVLQFRRAYARSDEMHLTALVRLVAHLLNQRVITEIVVLQIVTVFLEKLSNDSVKLCCLMLQECGQVLNEISPKGVFYIFERLRTVLQEGLVDKRTQYIIESLFEARRKKFVSHQGVLPELDLIEESDQVSHEIDVIEDQVHGEDVLNIFQAQTPEEYERSESEWRVTSDEILGVTESVMDDDVKQEEEPPSVTVAEPAPITDLTDQELVNLRRTIYLAIMSSANFEECVHKLLKLQLRAGQEKEVVNMLIDSCCSEKTSNRFYSLQGERLCRLSRVYKSLFENSFVEKYETMHRFETGKIRNMAKFFSHLFTTDCVDWRVLGCVRLTENDTTSSSRIFIKILFQDLNENFGKEQILNRFSDPKFADAFSGILPSDSAENIRFSINFFTAIGLGDLTPIQRKRLNEISLQIAMQEAEAAKNEQIKEEERQRDERARRDRQHDEYDERSHRRRSPVRDDDDSHRRRRSRSYNRL
jgi:pre-mRNA-splicing factor CWC22